MFEVNEKILNNINREEIVELWKSGFSIQQITKHFVKSEKKKGNKITKAQGQQYVEPIIFSYQTELMK